MRRNRASANSDRGSTGTTGNRNASSGSTDMVVSLFVMAAQRRARASQERLSAMEGSPEMLGHVGNRKPVEIAQRQRCPLWNWQVHQGRIRRLAVEPFVPRIVDVRN